MSADDRGANGPTDPGSPAREALGPPGQVSRGLALLVAGTLFMEILDATVIAPAAPHIGDDFGVPAVSLNIAISAYVLTLAVMIPLSGWLADRVGARRVFVLAVWIFTLASIGCAFATDLRMLTAMRVLQGLGGAMMVPVGRLVVLRTTAKTELVRAIAYLTWPALLAPVIAPAVGGLLSTYASWRLIFLVNVPLGIVGVVLARRLMPDVRGPATTALDWRGFTLTAVGVAALVVGLEGIGTGHADPVLVVGSLSVSLLALVAAVRYLLRTATPLLDLRVLLIPTYRVTAGGGSVFRAVITATPFLMALFLQVGLGWSAAQAGTILIALFVGNVAVKPATTPLMRRCGIRTVMLTAVVASAVCLLAMATLRGSTPVPVVIGVLFLSGIFRSIGFTAYNSVAFADVPPSNMTHANTLMSTLQELGAGLGVAVGALLVRLGGPLADDLGLGSGPDQAFRLAFAMLAVLLVGPALEALRLDPAAGTTVTGHRLRRRA
ncbi:MFS transporter [Nocardioides panacis]|uniref:MFS transporter n=1 Tax=Nocardioides panacis TaxID=2849501 RepID=A0A975Y1Y7_9ACTN|nr:MFS transporter [Nocardioides panacis]QWZ09996.1 MFS transporter [Nocardioides panacis]